MAEPLFIIVNGVDNHCNNISEPPKEPREIFFERFPGSHVEVFQVEALSAPNRLYNGETLRDNASKVITELQAQYGDGPAYTLKNPQPIIFLAHNIGAALAKQILLLAFERKKHQWIALNTVKLYLCESPSGRTWEHDWESFLTQLFGSRRLPLSHFVDLMPTLPLALANIDADFSAIADFFVVNYANTVGPDAVLFTPYETPWNFDTDSSTPLNPTILDIHNLLRNRTKITKLLPEYQKFLTYISDSDASSYTLQPSRVHASSSRWVESLESYRSWLDDPGSATMLVTAPPGSGKTGFASQVLQLLGETRDGQNDLFISFKFHRWDTRRDSERSFLLSVIRQLFTLRRKWFKHIQHIAKMIVEPRLATCEQLWSLLHLLRRVCGKVCIFIIIDGLDHCREPLGSKLAALMNDQGGAIFKLLLTSSICPQLLWDKAITVKLNDIRGWKDNVKEIVKAKVALIITKRPYWSEESDAIVEKLSSGEFSFLEIMLHLKLIECSCIWSTRTGLHEYLKTSLVAGNKVFEALLNENENKPVETLALNWIYFAARPLTVAELAVALALGQLKADIKKEGEVTLKSFSHAVSRDLRRDLQRLFNSVIMVFNDQIHFIHSEFREYLERSMILTPDFHAKITQTCISYIELVSNYHKTGEVNNSDELSVSLRFLDYADLFWPEHYKHGLPRLNEPTVKSEPLLRLDDTVKKFLSDRLSLPAWLDRYNSATGWNTAPPSQNALLTIATRLGFVHIIKGLTEQSHHEPPRGIQIAIDTAARAGDTTALDFLLSHGDASGLASAARLATEFGHVNALEAVFGHISIEEMDSLGADPRSPLMLAAPNGHTDVLKAILRRNGPIGNVTVGDPTKNNVVHFAAQLGDIRMLLAIRDARPDDFRDLCVQLNEAQEAPLILSARSGHPEVFRIILGESDINTAVVEKSETLMSALKQVVRYGRLAILEDLTTTTIPQIKTSATIRNTLLGQAVSSGHYDVVSWLMETTKDASGYGSDGISKMVDGDDQWGGHLKEWLTIAIEKGHVDIATRLLAQTEQRVIKQEQIHWIDQAIDNSRQLDMVRALVEHGPGGKLDTTEYTYSLDWSINTNSPDITSYLTDAGLRVMFDEDSKENHLHYAARQSRPFCLRELLSVAKSEDVLKLNGHGQLALDLAAKNGSLRAVKDLLQFAQQKIKDDHKWKKANTLTIAARSEITAVAADIIDLLLKNQWPLDNTDDEDHAILIAADRAATRIVELLLKHGVDANIRDGKRQTPLHLASKSGGTSIVDCKKTMQILLDGGADPNAQDEHGLTALHTAVKRGDIAQDLVHLLVCQDQGENASAMSTTIRKGVELNKATSNGSTALHFAVAHTEITKFLLSQKPQIVGSINAKLREEKSTPLMLAVEGGYVEVVALLLDKGAEVDAKDHLGRTSLHLNCTIFHTGSDRILKLLLEKEPKVNIRATDGETPLFKAIMQGRQDAVADLLAKGADPNICNNRYQSPLQLAILSQPQNRTIIDLLLKYKADVNAVGGSHGSALHAAAIRCDVRVVEDLLSHNGLPNLQVEPYGTPLHAIARNQKFFQLGTERQTEWRKLVELLVKNGAHINENYRGYEGLTPLMASIFTYNHWDFSAQVLLDNGAEITVKDSIGANPFHRAALFANITTIKLLLAKGTAGVGDEDKCGRSVLYMAAMSSTPDAADKFKELAAVLELVEQIGYLSAAIPPAVASGNEYILDFILAVEGVDVNTCDRNGWTGLDIAKSYKNVNLEQRLGSFSALTGAQKKKEPTVWSQFDREPSIQISEDGMDAWLEGLGWEHSDQVSSAVRADFCLPVDTDPCPYFEVTILEEGGEGLVGIGLCAEQTSLDLLAGWGLWSWGYHGDDGGLLAGNLGDWAQSFGLPYGLGAVIGVQMDFPGKRAAFFKDGEEVGHFDNVYGQLYPVVSFLRQRNTARVRANFGREPFRFPPPKPPAIASESTPES